MGIVLNSGCMVPVLPEGTFSIFPNIIRLGRAAGDQLDGLGQRITVSRILDKQMDVLCDSR